MPVTDEYTVSINLQARNQAALGAINQTNRALRQQQTEMGGIANSLRNIDGRFNAIQNAMGAAFLGVSAAGVVQFAGHLVSMGREANRAQMMFESFNERIGDTASMMDRLRAVTRGAIDDTSLQNAANSMLSMGLAQNADDLERLTNIGVTFAQAMGRDVSSSLENLGMLLANQSYLRLDTLGISSSQVRELAAQYRAAGMESSEAFTAAFMEVAEGMLPRMEAIADASVSAIDRAGASINNALSSVGQGLAIAANTGLEAIENIIAPTPDPVGLQEAATAAAAIYTDQFLASLENPQAMDRGFIQALFTNLYMQNERGALPSDAAGMVQLIERELAGVGLNTPELSGQGATAGLWLQQYLGTVRSVNEAQAAQAASAAQLEQNIAGIQSAYALVYDSLQPVLDATIRLDDVISSSVRERAPYMDTISQLWTLTGEMADLSRNGGLEFATSTDVERAAQIENQFETIYGYVQMAGDQGWLTDEQVSFADELRDNMGRMADNVERARDAFEDMTLDTALLRGENVDELQSGIYSQLDLSDLSEERRAAVLRALQLGSGEQSLSGAAFEDVTLGRIQGMVERGVSPERIAEEVRRASVLMRGLRMQGLGDEEMASALQLPIGFAASQYGIDLNASTGADYLANMQEAENVATRIDSTLALAPTYGEQLTTNLDAAFAQRRTLTIDLDVNTASIRGELANLIREIVGNSNGAVPGASTRRGRSSIER